MANSIRLMSLILLCPYMALANPLTAEEAKARADASEAALTPSETKGLLAAQAAVATSAFPACASRVDPAPADFTVIVEVASTGHVREAWIIGQSKFAQCFSDAMVRSFVYRPPRLPFFTAFEYTGK